jgi:hypothetical protein
MKYLEYSTQSFWLSMENVAAEKGACESPA